MKFVKVKMAIKRLREKIAYGFLVGKKFHCNGVIYNENEFEVIKVIDELMAEWWNADTQDLRSCILAGVRVQISPWLPNKN